MKRNMNRFATLLVLLVAHVLGHSAHSQIEPSAGMMRFPDISEDHIVFSYADDLWIVSRDGGTASPLASPKGAERFPRFSPDGKKIAFMGNYEGGTDIYTIGIGGGIAERMTYHSAGEVLCDWTPDGKSIVFASNGFGSFDRQMQLFTTSAKKPLPKQLPVPYGTNGAISPDGEWLAYTPHSRDGRTWKRYRGGMASDIWLFNMEDKTSKQMTNFEGTDSLPMWHGSKVYYLSDSGSEHRLNIWVYDTKSGERQQVTEFSDDDCKWPSIGPGKDGEGEIIFTNGPKMYVLNLKSEETRTVSVTVPGDRPNLRRQKIDASEFVRSGDISATGKRVVIEARGDIWTAPAKKGSPRNLTRTDGAAERFPIWSPDGRWIAYLSDESGEYEMYVTQSDGRGETRQLTKDGNSYRQSGNWSPDSKHLTFTDKSGALYLVEVESGDSKLVDTDPFAEEMEASWSHDSNWLCYAKATDTRAPSSNIWVYNIKDGTQKQLTSGFFQDSNPTFDRKGEYIFFSSNRQFTSPTYEDLGTSFIYANTEVLLAMPLREDIEYPLLPKSDEEEWEEEEDDKDKDGEDSDEESDEKDGDKKDDDDSKDGDEEGEDGDSEDEDDESDDEDESDDSENSGEDSTPSDPITGTWDIELNHEAIPADEANASMNLELADDGSVSGTVDTPNGTRTISSGKFDKDSGELTLTVDADGETAIVTATVSDNEMTGTVNMGGIAIDLTGTRSVDDDEESAKDNGKGKKKSKKKKKKDEPLEIDFDGIERRAFQLPVGAGQFGTLAVNDKNHLIFASIPSGAGGTPTIKILDIKDEKKVAKTVVSGVATYGISSDGKKLIVLQGDKLYVVSAAAGQKLTDAVNTKGMMTMVDPREEWKQIFWEAWRLERDFFYDPNMHGVDWDAIGKHYEKMLVDCVSRRDVGFIIREMISELNVGHAYYRPGNLESGPGANVGLLGCRFEADGDRYKMVDFFEGAAWDSDARNPLKRVGIKEGQYLLEINGIELKTDESPYMHLEGTTDQTISLTVSDDAELDEDDKRILFKPISRDNNLRFRSWIEKNRSYIEEKTGGRVGYIYVINTGVPGQNDLVRQLYGQLNKDALIIDDRWNGGGQIPTRFIELLNRPATNYWARRDGRDWSWPPDAHFGPKCMLINGMAGSGGDMFPALFRQNKLGKLVGMRTWGGLVGITGSPPLLDGASVTAPSFAYYEKDGTWGIEGHGVDPDIKVVDDPAKMLDGGDPQLDAAIELMLSELESGAFKAPKRPEYPDRSKMGIAPEDK